MNTHTPVRTLALFVIVALAMATTSTTAFAQAVDENITNYVPETEIKQQEGKKQGIDGTFGITAQGNMTSNDSVVGQVDGFSLLVGLGLMAGLDYVYGKHEVRNTLKLNQAWARTPVLDEFVKGNDVLDLESVYNYFLLSWAGPFARLNLETSILQAEDILAEPRSYSIARTDGTTVLTEPVDRLTLSEPFQPLTLNESIGIFTEPIQTTPFNLSIRVGFGARETFAKGVLVIDDDDTTSPIEAVELGDVYQGGAELFVGARGVFDGKRVSYYAGASALVPFINNDPQDRSATELTRLGLVGGMTFALYEWMSINYQFKILDDPQLLDKLQVQNNVLMTFSYTFIERNENLGDMPDPAVQAADKARADDAEKKAADSAAEAAQLREELDAAKKAAAEAEAKKKEEEKKEEEPEPTPDAPANP